MKNPNSPATRVKNGLLNRWSAEDYPGAKPRFQIQLFAKDATIFVLLPSITALAVKAMDSGIGVPKKHPVIGQTIVEPGRTESTKSQIITFATPTGTGSAFPRRSPGALVHVRLLNSIETYSSAPVHAQITDAALGAALKGGTLIGDATPDTNFDRITISFRFARDPNREGVAVPISARALGLDGTLGLEAEKKEGFVARSAIGSAALGSQDLQKGNGSNDFRDLLFKALTAGFFQELGTSTQVLRNRAQVLTVAPQTEFYAELTDYFPGGAR